MNDVERDNAQRARHVFETPLGPMRIEEDENGIAALRFTDEKPDGAKRAGRYLADAEAQVLEYFAGMRRDFDVPISLSGTGFQMRVWHALPDIPYGETRSYRDLAAAIGSPGATRAVGQANRRNPVMLLIPCHRVIERSGKIGGYAGGIERKRFLLELEAGRR